MLNDEKLLIIGYSIISSFFVARGGIEMKSMREIQLTPYNIAWEKEFSKEAATLTTIMSAQVLGVHHIGSTAVPGLSAKPIIDLLIEVKDIKK